MRRSWSFAVALLLLPWLASAQGAVPDPSVPSASDLAADPSVPSASDLAADLAALSIGIAPFERVAPPGLGTPDLGTELAGQILAKGAGRTLSPASLAGAGRAEPSKERVRELARQHELDALVVGRITRLGQRVSLDVRLRDGRSGAVAGTYVAELALADPPEAVLERLAAQLVAGAMALAHVSLAPPGSGEPAPGRASTRPTAVGGLQLDRLDPDEPFSIRADELEATEREGGRTLIFRKNVVAKQGDLVLRASRLEAVYPAGAKQPTQLRARGGVSVKQGQREARCQRAEYLSRDQKIICTGDARLRDGENELRGESIVFDLEAERVTVEGGTELALSQSGDDDHGREAGVGPLGELPGEGAVTIRAEQLEATRDDRGWRRIRFGGSVEVAQEDIVLSARQIEALYPPGAEEPERLIATGDVVVLQGRREARCEQAVYRAPERRVDCAGSASLREGADQVTGEVIAFDLEAEKLTISGGTRLVLAPRDRGERATP